MTSQDFNQTDRAASLKALSDQCFDLLVIGGGITGMPGLPEMPPCEACLSR